ncbi:MAG: response regulator, partial [Limnochordales bacterium]
MSHPPAEQRLRVIVLEDEPLYLDLLVKALAWYPQFDIVGTFADARSCLAAAPALQPQVALLDIELPGDMTGIDVGLELRDALPGLGIVLLSNHY